MFDIFANLLPSDDLSNIILIKEIEKFRVNVKNIIINIPSLGKFFFFFFLPLGHYVSLRWSLYILLP